MEKTNQTTNAKLVVIPKENRPQNPNQLITDCEIGVDTKIWGFVNLYGCVIGNRCMVGTFTEIQSGCFIDDDSRIQSHSFLPSGTEIGKNVFWSHHSCGINDDFKNHKVNYGKSDWKKIIVEDDVTIGSNCTIMPVRIGKGSVIGANSFVNIDIPPYSLAYGNPVRIIKSLDKK
jgi:acetyltransferase-like isoleucine patch superfamily enzyme